MNRPTIFVLIALNALLAVVLVGEWYVESETPTTEQAQVKTDAAENEELPSLDLSATNEEGYSDLVERPLFIKGRKPVSEPVPESVPVAAVKKVEAFVWELTGVFATPKGVTAFFSRTGAKVPKDNYRKQKIGDEIDGWKLSEIHPDNVTLTLASETKILPLRKAKPKTPVPVQAQPVAQNPNNKPPPRQPPGQQPVPALQNAQTRDATQNVEPQAEEASVEAVPQSNE